MEISLLPDFPNIGIGRNARAALLVRTFTIGDPVAGGGAGGQCVPFRRPVAKLVAVPWRFRFQRRQAELFPRVVAALTWPDLLRDHLVIWWHDNESARAASIRGYSPVLESCRILAEAAVCEAALHCRSWFARVPTASNVSDPASRLDYPEVWRLVPGAVQSEPVLLKEWAHVLSAPAQV